MKIPILEVVKPPEQELEYLPEVHHLHHGLFYTRWFVISAFIDALLVGVGNFWLEPVWHISSWPTLDQFILGGSIFALFILGSICAFLTGYRFFEAQSDPRVRSKRSQALNLENLRVLLGFWGILVGLICLYDWFQKNIRPIPCTLALIFLFLVIWTLFNHSLRRKEKIFNDKYLPFLSWRYLFLRLFLVKIPLNARKDDLETVVVGMRVSASNTSANPSQNNSTS